MSAQTGLAKSGHSWWQWPVAGYLVRRVLAWSAQHLCLGSVCSLGKRLRRVTWQPCTILHSCHQHPRVLTRPYPYQHVLGVASKILATRASGACEESIPSGTAVPWRSLQGPMQQRPPQGMPLLAYGAGKGWGLCTSSGLAPHPQPQLLPPLRASAVASSPSAKFTSFFLGEQVLSGPEVLVWPSHVIALGGTDLLFHRSVQTKLMPDSSWSAPVPVSAGVMSLSQGFVMLFVLQRLTVVLHFKQKWGYHSVTPSFFFIELELQSG